MESTPSLLVMEKYLNNFDDGILDFVDIVFLKMKRFTRYKKRVF